jgi:hypothetical protein
MMKFLIAFTTCFLASSIILAQDLEWVFQIVPQDNTPTAVDIDADDNVYIAGGLQVAAADFDPGPGTVIFPNLGSEDAYVAKYTPSRELEWAFSFGDQGLDRIEDMHVIGNTIYTMGIYKFEPDIDPGPDTVLLSGSFGPEVVIAKYTTDGDYISSFTLMDGITVYDMGIDGSGNIFLTGLYAGTVDFDPSANDEILISQNGEAFIAKYDSNNGFQWVTTIASCIPSALRIDNNDDIILGGEFSGTIDIDPSANTANLSSISINDCFLAKYDGNGNYVWATSFKGESGDKITLDAMDINSNNDICITGGIIGVYEFDPVNAPGVTLDNDNSSQFDIYLLSYSTDGVLNWSWAFGESNEELTTTLKVGPEDAIWIGGGYHSAFAPIDMNPDFSTDYLPELASQKCFIAKYSENGAFIYAHAIYSGTGGGSWASITDLAIGDAGSLYLQGYIEEDADFDFSANDSIVDHFGGSPSIFLAKYHESLVGLEESTENQFFNVYPNPASEHVLVNFAGHTNGELTLYDITGQRIMTTDVNTEELPLSLAGIAPGLYLLHFVTGDQVQVEQIIIQ